MSNIFSSFFNNVLMGKGSRVSSRDQRSRKPSTAADQLANTSSCTGTQGAGSHRHTTGGLQRPGASSKKRSFSVPSSPDAAPKFADQQEGQLPFGLGAAVAAAAGRCPSARGASCSQTSYYSALSTSHAEGSHMEGDTPAGGNETTSMPAPRYQTRSRQAHTSSAKPVAKLQPFAKRRCLDSFNQSCKAKPASRTGAARSLQDNTPSKQRRLSSSSSTSSLPPLGSGTSTTSTRLNTLQLYQAPGHQANAAAAATAVQAADAAHHPPSSLQSNFHGPSLAALQDQMLEGSSSGLLSPLMFPLVNSNYLWVQLFLASCMHPRIITALAVLQYKQVLPFGQGKLQTKSI